MTKLHFPLGILFLAAGLVLTAISSGSIAAGKRPNIIYIMVDDLGYGDVGCYGQKVIQTPNIDRLAQEGIRFTDHYSGHTVCRPSRLVLWTGMHSGHTTINSNAQYVLKPEEKTVAEHLKQAGYVTGGVGKWANGNVTNSGHPNRQGFDFWMGYLDQSAAHNYYPEYLWRNMDKVVLKGNKEGPAKHVSVKRVTYSHDVMTTEALGFIRRHGNGAKPFLLHVHWTIPHTNNQGGRATGDGQEVPDYGQYADKEWPSPEKGFAAMITRMDGDIGRIDALLQEMKIRDNTLLIFTSDNGPHQEGGHKVEYFNSNGELRGFKRDLYEGGIRVPMIARWPGKIQPGSLTSHPSAFYDWLPTACEIAGAKQPMGIDGVSYAATLLGEKQQKHPYLYWQYGAKQAARIDQWKGVRVKKNGPLEVYDLTADVGERKNIASQKPDVAQRLEAAILDATR